jgi:hypothetical protein
VYGYSGPICVPLSLTVYSSPTKVRARKVLKGDLPEGNNILRYTQIILEGINMPITMDGQTYYRTAEVCRMVGISRNTLLRWLKEGIFSEVEYRDWRGWRLFTEVQIDRMKAKTNQINTISYKKSQPDEAVSNYPENTDEKQ